MRSKRIIALLFALLFVGILGISISRMFIRQSNDRSETFVQEATALLQALQTYRKSINHFPDGSPAEIMAALSGESGEQGRKVLLLTEVQFRKDSQGQALDPWNTPLQFFFTQDKALIRSAGPNRAFEDDSSPVSDDLFVSDAK